MTGRLASAVLLLGLAAACESSAVCAGGFELQNGLCVPVCPPCGVHATCATTATSAQCQCVAGYAGDPCEWVGVIANPNFAVDESWQKINGAKIEPLLGFASFPSEVTCSAGAISQIVEMPSYEDAQPLVVEVDYREENTLGVEVGYGRAFRRLQSTGAGLHRDRLCLGEAGHGEDGNGGPVKFQIAAGERWPNCFSAPEGFIEVYRFEVLPAAEGECPAPGSLLNGEATIDGGGWFFDVQETGIPVTTGALEAGVGESGSSGARIHKPAGGEDFAAMVTQLSVPLPSPEVPSPALRFWWQGNPAWWYWIDLGTYPGLAALERPLDALFGEGAPQTSTYCLPPWTHGNVVDLSFVMQGGFFADEAELIADNVEIISDSRCGDSTDLLDPSFDSAPNRWPGVAIRFEEEPSSAVRVLNDPVRAHPPGPGLLELRYARSDARLEAQHWVWIPPGEASRGPQLVFHSNVPTDPGLSVFWTLGSVTGPNLDCTEERCPPTPLSQELSAGLGWRRNQVCLPAEWAERWYRVRVAIRPSEGPLELFDPPRSVLLDDFEVGLDEACPTASQ